MVEAHPKTLVENQARSTICSAWRSTAARANDPFVSRNKPPPRYGLSVTTAPLPLRIFLATPGDLSDERQVVATTIEEHNRRHRGKTNPGFQTVGWEQVRGTAQRPQEAISELISGHAQAEEIAGRLRPGCQGRAAARLDQVWTYSIQD